MVTVTLGGCNPGVLTRHPADVRWTGVVQKLLGSEYNIIENGINGRSTVWDDPANQCRNGLSGLGYALYSAKPLDLVVLMLGANDLNYTDIWQPRLGIPSRGCHISIKNPCQAAFRNRRPFALTDSSCDRRRSVSNSSSRPSSSRRRISS